MHFVRLVIDENKLEQKIKALGDNDLKNFNKIPRIVNEDSVWVSTTDLPDVQHALGDAIKSVEEFDYKDNSRVKFTKGSPNSIPVLLELMREIAVILGYKKAYVVHGGSEKTIPQADLTDPDNFFLFINLLPIELVGRKQTTGKLRFGQVETKMPTGVKLSFVKIIEDRAGYKVIKDDDGIPIGAHRANRVWVPFDLVAVRGGFEKDWYPTLVAREIIARALASAASKTSIPLDNRNDELEKCRADFIKHCRSDVDMQKRALEKDIKRGLDEVKKIEAKIAQIYDEVRKNSITLQGLEREDGRDAFLDQQFSMIKDHIPLVRSIRFIRNGIEFETEIIHLEADSNLRKRVKFDPFPLGRYRVRLTRGSDPHITNLSHRLRYSSFGDEALWDHPHVHEHIPCLGNIRSKLAKLVSEDKWFGAISYMIEALKNINSADGWAWKGFDRWKEAAPEVLEEEMEDGLRDRVRNWVSYRHQLPLGLMAKVGDEVVAKCPDSCPLKGGKCRYEGDGIHAGKIETFYEDRVGVAWEDGDKNFRCPGFTYDSISKPNGDPIVQGYGEIVPDRTRQARVEEQEEKAEPLPNHTGPIIFDDLIEGFVVTYNQTTDMYECHHQEYDIRLRLSRAAIAERGEEHLADLLLQAKRPYEEDTPPPAMEVNVNVVPTIDQDPLNEIVNQLGRIAETQRNIVQVPLDDEGDTVIPTMDPTTEDLQDEPIDELWGEEVQFTPEDDDLLEAFNEGLELGSDF